MSAIQQMLLGQGGGNTYDPATVAFLAAMSPSIASKYEPIINNLVVALKADGVWTELDAMYLLTLTTSQQSRLNLIAPTGADAQLNVVGSPTFTANVGWSCMGNNSHALTMNTACGSLGNFTQNDASFGVYISSPGAENAFCCGEASTYNVLSPNYLGANMYGKINMASNSSISAGGGGTGLKAFNRTASNAYQMYNNGSQFSSGSTASASNGLGNVFRWLNAGASVPQTVGTERIAFIGGSMTGTKHAALYTAINTFLTAYDAA